MKQRDGFFFYSSYWTPKAEGLPTFLSPPGQRAALQTAVNYIHLSNILHLPLSTSCLIHRLRSFPSVSFSSGSEVFMMDGWWISGYRKVRVTGVRHDQIRRSNIRVLVGERRRWKKREKVRLSWGIECERETKAASQRVSMLHSLCHMSACLFDLRHAQITWFIIYMT